MTLFKPRVGKVIFAQTTGGLSVIIPIIYLSVKQNLDKVWFLGSHSLGKLILLIIYVSIKQNLDHT